MEQKFTKKTKTYQKISAKIQINLSKKKKIVRKTSGNGKIH